MRLGLITITETGKPDVHIVGKMSESLAMYRQCVDPGTSVTLYALTRNRSRTNPAKPAPTALPKAQEQEPAKPQTWTKKGK